MATIIVCIIKMNPKDRGWLIKIRINDKVHLIIENNNKISENSLIKILVLEIKDG